MECNQELEALFNLNNPEFLLLAVDKLNKETEAKTANQGSRRRERRRGTVLFSGTV